MTELLAPAGDLERLKIALLYGADAVYLGGRDYSLRANAKNFSIEELNEACTFAHSLGKRIYVTVNIVFHDKNLENLEEYLQKLKEIKVDAVIVSDIIGVKMAQEVGLDIILSTQASTLNYEAVNFWKNLGVKRIVLGREANREDIIRIKEETNVEIECFIHGAMCTSISGKCVLSNYCTNRDSNRGGCAQICRWVFTKDGSPDFTFMSKDLNMVDYLEEMIKIGVNSFKVEGRMRSIYYIATVIMCYRKMIDGIVNKSLPKEDREYYSKILDRVANRDTTPQFFHEFPGVNESYFSDRTEVSNQDFLGIVLDYDKENKYLILEQRNYFKIGDIVEFIGPNMDTLTYTISTIVNEDGEKIDVARHPKMIVKLPLDIELEKYAMMRIKVFDKKSVL
ncbi:MAG: U32 family peptidase [Firmicutes bacterium]|nr:U32 family peptidase [Bacillota bacterium]